MTRQENVSLKYFQTNYHSFENNRFTWNSIYTVSFIAEFGVNGRKRGKRSTRSRSSPFEIQTTNRILFLNKIIVESGQYKHRTAIRQQCSWSNAPDLAWRMCLLQSSDWDKNYCYVLLLLRALWLAWYLHHIGLRYQRPCNLLFWIHLKLVVGWLCFRG